MGTVEEGGGNDTGTGTGRGSGGKGATIEGGGNDATRGTGRPGNGKDAVVDGEGNDIGAGALAGKVSANGVGVMSLSGGSSAGGSSGWNGGELREEGTDDVKGELKEERVVPSEDAAGSSISDGTNGAGGICSMSVCELEGTGESKTGELVRKMGAVRG